LTYLSHLILPMQDVKHLDMDRVEYYKQQMKRGHIFTALALSRLDHRTPVKMLWSPDYHYRCHTLTTLGHYILDGHHKIHAAGMYCSLVLRSVSLTLATALLVGEGFKGPGGCNILAFVVENRGTADCHSYSISE